MIAAEEYGRALYTLANEDGGDASAHAYLQTLQQIDTLLSDQPAYRTLLDTPALPTDEKLGLIDAAFGGCEQNILNFIKILCEKRAIFQLHACVDAYAKLYREQHAMTEARCVSAYPMTQEQTEALRAKLSAMTGKDVSLICDVDTALIGGMVVYVDGKRLDGSIRARLDAFRQGLEETIV